MNIKIKVSEIKHTINNNNCVKDEIFIPIKHNTNYKIGNKGTIINKHGNKCKPFIINSGYYAISLWNNNKKKNYLVHKLVAEHFLDNYTDSLDIDHIDNNKLNNNINNLQLITHQENCIKRITPNVALVTKSGDIIKEYASFEEAGRNLHIGKETLRKNIVDYNITPIYSKVNKCIMYFKRINNGINIPTSI